MRIDERGRVNPSSGVSRSASSCFSTLPTPLGEIADHEHLVRHSARILRHQDSISSVSMLPFLATTKAAISSPNSRDGRLQQLSKTIALVQHVFPAGIRSRRRE